MRILRHLRGNAVAYLALAVALGGTSYAATKLPAKSVGTKQLAASAVTSKKVKDSSLLQKDFKAGQLPAGATGQPGPPGPTFGAILRENSSDPPVNPDGAADHAFAFTLPSAGSAYLRWFMGRRKLNCSAGNGRIGMYVDGSPVPGSSIPLESTATSDVAIELLALVHLSAGAHVADIRVDCPSGTPGAAFSDSRPTWTVLLLGDG